MNRDYKLFIEDIKKSIEQIEKYVRDISEEGFKRDLKIQDAVIRRLEIIGEASKKIPKSVRNVNKHINWEALSRYRDFIVHSYFEASLNRIWKRAKEELPKLKDDFKNIKLL
ncbi:MAG: hypothetical protein QT10_C0014G0007 [archaeon GW2011_AR19]|nr:MAG: hypothetical protein QT10_C0014G0007 [archaeon GW2011_AR19]